MVERFEDLEIWHLARQLVKSIFTVCQQGVLARDFDIRSQFRRAGLSCMNNIAEGFGRRHSSPDFIRFLNYTQSSCCEVKSMTYVLEDMNYLDLETARRIREQSEKLKAKTLALISYLRR